MSSHWEKIQPKQVEKVTEHEDGSATVVFDCNEQARQTLINEGLISLLEKAVSQQNPEYDWTTHKKENENEWRKTNDYYWW